MNFSATDSVIGRPRCRLWTPLITQQLRLRHLYQITAFNLSANVQGPFYYTLHLTPMSAPFYTSEIADNVNPSWAEIDVENLSHGAASTFVLRIWQKKENETDTIILTWAINLSGLVYMGGKKCDIQPSLFVDNSVIFYMRGGYFSSIHALRTDLQDPLPFIDHLNLVGYENAIKVFKNTSISFPSTEVRRSYNLMKLQRLHSLQITNKNKSFDCKVLRDKITSKCCFCSTSKADDTRADDVAQATNKESSIRYAPQLLTMNSLNKMLQEKPTKFQRQEIVRISKEIEVAKFKTKLLMQERDKKTALLRQLKQKHTELCDTNEERHSQLMENYHKLHKETEKLREWKKILLQHREIHANTCMQLQHRQRQLMQQLLFIYPIRHIRENHFVINEIYLPNSDMLLDHKDGDTSVALGYITHILTICSSFLQVPLRYPVCHVGSRSYITDQISVNLNNRDREFPLFAKGKDRGHFGYAVFLLNKNIAQLRWFCNLHTLELKATLSNLYTLLKGKERSNVPILSAVKQQEKHQSTENALGSSSLSLLLNYISHSNISDPLLDSLRQECQIERNSSPPSKSAKKTNVKPSRTASGPSLSEILAIPEAFLNRQISPDSFKNYMSSRYYSLSCLRKMNNDVGEISSTSKFLDKIEPNCDIDASNTYENIEQGTDLITTDLININADECRAVEIKPDVALRRQCDFIKVDNHGRKKQQRPLSRSVGSYTDDECTAGLESTLEMGSDPLISIVQETNTKETEESTKLLPSSLEGGQQEFLQKWLNSGQSATNSEENLLYPEEVSESSSFVSSNSNPLTARADALLHTTSFNLVKPKL